MSFRSSIFQRFRFNTSLKFSHYADKTDLIGRIIDHAYKRIVTSKALARHYVWDASCRKQVPLSAYLNYHYLNAKKGSPQGYYPCVFKHSLKHVALVKYGLNFKGQQQLMSLVVFSAFRKCIYYVYVFLLQIPVAAKRTHWQEESFVRRNAPQNGI